MAIVVGIGLAKFWHMQYHEHRPELAPTKKLKDAFMDKKITWTQYQKEGYEDEKGFDELITSRPEAQKYLRHWKKEYANSPTKHLTLLCYCPDKHICHRSLIKKKILEIEDIEGAIN